MEVLNDRTTVANANLKADMERWHKNKQRDVKEILITLADRQIRFYERVSHFFSFYSFFFFQSILIICIMII